MLDPNKPSNWWIMAVNIWKSCVHCGWRNKYRIDPSSYEHCWTSCWNKAWKKFRLVRDLNPWEQHLATIFTCCQPFHFQDLIYLVILLTVHHAILVIPIPISWEFGIGSAANPLLKFFFILITCLILYWYCMEKFCLGHLWELKDLLLHLVKLCPHRYFL